MIEYGLWSHDPTLAVLLFDQTFGRMSMLHSRSLCHQFLCCTKNARPFVRTGNHGFWQPSEVSGFSKGPSVDWWFSTSYTIELCRNLHWEDPLFSWVAPSSKVPCGPQLCGSQSCCQESFLVVWEKKGYDTTWLKDKVGLHHSLLLLTQCLSKS